MGRAWATYQLFGLLVVGFWREGTAAGLDMDELYASLAARLRVNLIARSLR
jgi:hypothetical protein